MVGPELPKLKTWVRFPSAAPYSTDPAPAGFFVSGAPVFKQLTIYQLADGLTTTLEQAEAALAAQPFTPCGPTQTLSVGWVAPRGLPHAPLVEAVAGHWLMRFRIETKRVPATVLRQELQERCARIQAEEGRTPGRREQRELKDAIEQELLPLAFPASADVQVWLDRTQGRLALDTTVARRIDLVTSALTESLSGLRLQPLQTALTPASAMAGWLAADATDWPPHFAPGREVELKGDGDRPAVVRFTRHVLDREDMQRHLAQGKRPTRLALDWEGRVQFVLTDTLQLRRLAFDDGVFTAQGQADDGGFDTDAAIATGELGALLTDLIQALGGLAPTPP